jgi:hypothetical protein
MCSVGVSTENVLTVTGTEITLYHCLLKPVLPSHKVRNGVRKVPDGVTVRYKIFPNGVHLWGT